MREHSDAVERTLRRVYGVRYTDRWRRDTNGQRLLTLREIWVYLHDLPDDAPLVIAINGEPRWSRTDYLLADLYQVWTGKAHYARPATKKPAEPANDKAVRATLSRFAQRNHALAQNEERG